MGGSRVGGGAKVVSGPSFLNKNIVSVKSNEVMYAAQLNNSAVAARGRVIGAAAQAEEERTRQAEQRRKQAELLRHVPAGGGAQLRQHAPTVSVATRLGEGESLSGLANNNRREEQAQRVREAVSKKQWAPGLVQTYHVQTLGYRHPKQQAQQAGQQEGQGQQQAAPANQPFPTELPY
jgi:hypothetical protein